MQQRPYRDLIEQFLLVTSAKYPLIKEIRDHFFTRAGDIQNGGPEYYYSEEHLGIWWPDDEYQLIRLSVEGKLNSFYREASSILINLLKTKNKKNYIPLLEEALNLNQGLLKQPNLNNDIDAWKRENSTSRFIPYQYHLDENTIKTKNGSGSQILLMTSFLRHLLWSKFTLFLLVLLQRCDF